MLVLSALYARNLKNKNTYPYLGNYCCLVLKCLDSVGWKRRKEWPQNTEQEISSSVRQEGCVTKSCQTDRASTEGRTRVTHVYRKKQRQRW